MIIDLCPDARINLTRPPYNTEGLTVCVLGNKGAGKSNIAAVIAEEAHRHHIPFIYYDPNGDCASFRELGDDVIVLGDPNHDQPIRRADYPLALAISEAGDFIRMVLQEGYSLAVDMTEYNPDDCEHHPLVAFAALVNEHYRQAARLRTPAFVLVDEAQAIAPQSGATKLEKLSKRALGRVASDGRKRGMALATFTQRATYLDKRIIFGANLRIFGKITWWPDYDLIKHYVPATFNQMKALRSGDVFIMSDNGWGKHRIKLRHTTDLGKTPAFKPKQRSRRPSKIKQLQLEI